MARCPLARRPRALRHGKLPPRRVSPIPCLTPTPAGDVLPSPSPFPTWNKGNPFPPPYPSP